MRVILNQLWCSPLGSYPAGSAADVPMRQAAALVRGGYARPLDSFDPAAVCPVKPMPAGRPKLAFLGPCYNVIGGTERWHDDLIPRLKALDVIGYAVQEKSRESPAVPVTAGPAAMRRLAAAADIVVVWGLGAELYDLLPEPRPLIVWIAHGSSEWTAAKARAIAPIVDRFGAVSPVAETITPPPCTRIDNGVDLDRLKPKHTRAAVRAKLGINPDQVAVVAPHRLSQEKRMPLLARGIEAAGPGFVLIAAGTGPDRAALENRPQIRLLGARDDVPDLLAAADLFALASEHEGCSLAMLEAMAVGLPVVATPVGMLTGRPELARIVPIAAGPEAWGEAFRADQADAPGRHARTARAQAVIRAEFDIAREASEWEALFLDLIAAHRRKANAGSPLCESRCSP